MVLCVLYSDKGKVVESDKFCYKFFNLGRLQIHAFNLHSDNQVDFQMTHFVNLRPLVFQLERAMCCLPTDISGNLESRSKLLYVSLTFPHNAQWGLASQLRIFRFCFTVSMGLPLAENLCIDRQSLESLQQAHWKSHLGICGFLIEDPKFQEI